jgi:hypothetical protein
VSDSASLSEGGDHQKKLIEAQIKDEKKTLEVIKERRKWFMAIKAVYGISTALAILEAILAKPPVFKPDLAGCTINPASHKGLEKALIMGYSSLLMVGGDIKGAAIMLGAGALAGALFKFKIGMEVAGQTVDKGIPILNKAEGRIAVFGASTALVVMIDSGLKKEEERSKKKISDLEKLKNSLDQSQGLAEGSSKQSDSSEGQVDPNAASQLASKNVTALSQGVELPRNCFSQSGSNGITYSENCSNPLKVNRVPSNMKIEIPTLAVGSKLASDMAQAMSDGDLKKAEISAGSLAQMASRIDKINKDLLKKYNDDLKAKGQKPVDIDAELTRQVMAFDQALNKASPGSSKINLADLIKRVTFL